MAARRRGDEEWNTGVQKTCQALETDVAEKNGTMYRVGEAPGSRIAEPQSSGWTGARTRHVCGRAEGRRGQRGWGAVNEVGGGGGSGVGEGSAGMREEQRV